MSKITGEPLEKLYEQSFETMRWEHEASEIRYERREKRFFNTIIILIILLVLTNFGWLIYESSFEDVEKTTYSVEQQTEEGDCNNFMNGGDAYNGLSESN